MQLWHKGLSKDDNVEKMSILIKKILISFPKNIQDFILGNNRHIYYSSLLVLEIGSLVKLFKKADKKIIGTQVTLAKLGNAGFFLFFKCAGKPDEVFLQ